MLTALDHVLVLVEDLEGATSDAAALFGGGPSWRGEHPGAGTTNALFQVSNTALELLSPSDPGPVGELLRRRLGDEGEGLLGLAFATGDASACAATLRARGLAALDPRPGRGRDAGGRERRWRNVHLPGDATRGVLLFAIERDPASALESLAPDGTPGAAVTGLDHVVVRSPHLEGARALYGDGLGLRLALDRSFEGRGLRMLFFRVGGVTVEVVGSLANAPDPSAPDRLWGLAWQVGDAEAAHRRLVGEGFDLTTVREGHKPGTRVFTVKDRTANVPTLLIEPAPRP